ncbi:MAG: TonB-dependent receptor [Dysgonamonadaceae bacterium]|jgi:outer membrane cobalamin receptor|nr:TonB-dependent receptor [Dysgonamonadaceae bacterium]
MWTDLRKFIYFIVLLCLLPFGMEAQEHVTDTLSGGSLNEVRVSASLRPSATRSTVPLQVMDAGTVDRLGIQSLSDAVRHFSGVTVKDYGGLGGIKTVSIRSMGASHTAVSYDGVTLSDARSGQVDIGRFSLDNLSLITLSIGQGDDIFQPARIMASAGSLNLKTNPPIFKDTNYLGIIQVKTGSFGFVNPSLQYSQKFNDVFSAAVFGNWQRTDGDYPFTFKNGNETVHEKRKNSDLKSLNGELNLYGNFRKNGRVNIKAYYYDSERGLPGAVIIDNYYPSREQLKDRNFFAQLHYENLLSHGISIRGQMKYNYAYTDYTNPVYNQEDEYRQNEYYISGCLLYTPFDALSVSFAEDAYINTLWNNFPDCQFPERFSSLTALSVKYDHSRLTVIGNLLGTFITENVDNGTTPADRKKISPSVSASYLPFAGTNLRMRASYKNVFRVPTFNELYYYRIGNTNLKPENTIQYNLGLTWIGSFNETFRYLTASVDAYYNKVQDKIIAIPTLFLPKMMNVGKVEARGIDVNLSAKIRLKKHWEMTVSGNYSYQKAIDITDESSKQYKDQIPYTPEHSGSGAVSLENPWVNISYSFILTGLRYSFSQNIPENRIDGYYDQNISLNKTVKIRKMNLKIQGDVLNLADQSYEIIKWYPMPGRSYRLSLKWSF